MMNIYVRQPGSPLNSIRTRRALRGVRSRHSTTVEPRASVIRVAARCRCHRGNLARIFHQSGPKWVGASMHLSVESGA